MSIVGETFRGYVWKYSPDGDPIVKLYTPTIRGRFVFLKDYQRRPNLGDEVEYKITREFSTTFHARLIQILE